MILLDLMKKCYFVDAQETFPNNLFRMTILILNVKTVISVTVFCVSMNLCIQYNRLCIDEIVLFHEIFSSFLFSSSVLNFRHGAHQNPVSLVQSSRHWHAHYIGPSQRTRIENRRYSSQSRLSKGGSEQCNLAIAAQEFFKAGYKILVQEKVKTMNVSIYFRIWYEMRTEVCFKYL